MLLELESLKRAVTAMDAVLARSNDIGLMDTLDEVTRSAVRSGAIQHFEFNYELCWKFMKRWLEMNISPAVADGVTRRELFRQAAENHLIDDVNRWMRHHDARNRTAYTYDPAVAETVYESANEFVQDAKRLLEALVARND